MQGRQEGSSYCTGSFDLKTQSEEDTILGESRTIPDG